MKWLSLLLIVLVAQSCNNVSTKQDSSYRKRTLDSAKESTVRYIQVVGEMQAQRIGQKQFDSIIIPYRNELLNLRNKLSPEDTLKLDQYRASVVDSIIGKKRI